MIIINQFLNNTRLNSKKIYQLDQSSKNGLKEK
jgi:hypothetical protein